MAVCTSICSAFLSHLSLFFVFNNIYLLYIQVSLSVTVLNVCELVLPLPLPSPGNQYFTSKNDLYERDNVE